MLKLLKNNFKTTNDCIILAAPLIIFLSLLKLYADYAIDSIDNISKLIWSIVTAIVMYSGFLSVWLYMVKKTMALSKKVFIFDKDRVKALFYLTMSLQKGFGQLFLPILGANVLILGIFILLFYSITYGVSHHFGSFPLDNDGFIAFITLDKTYLTNFAEQLSITDLSILNIWYMLLNVGTAIITFFTLLWIPEMVYSKKNTITALFNSFRKMISGMPETILLFVYIVMLTLFMKFVGLLVLINPLLYFLALIIYYYYIVYIIVLLFSYYEQNYTEN